ADGGEEHTSEMGHERTMPDTVSKALVKSGRDKGSTAVTEHKESLPGRGEVQIDVEACGLCGSDVHAWRGDQGYEWIRTPVVLGHELVGRVTAVGAGSDPSWSGKRVVPISVDGCHDCEVCAAGSAHICPGKRVLGLSFDGGGASRVVVPVRR